MDNYLVGKDRRIRIIRKPSRYLDSYLVILAFNASVSHNYVPDSYQDAISYSNSSKWFNVMKEELDSLKKNETWNLVKKPKKNKLVSYK